MEIAYTTEEGGEWQYFNSPLSCLEICDILEEALEDTGTEEEPKGFPAVFDSGDKGALFFPDGDTLPKFHSILLPDGSRWDALNLEWAPCDVRSHGKSAHYADQVFQVLRGKASWVPPEWSLVRRRGDLYPNRDALWGPL